MAEKNSQVMEAVVAGLIGIAAVVIQYLMTSRSAQIDAKAWWARAQSWYRSASDAERMGERFAEWYYQDQARGVVDRAEEITREEVPE